MSLRHSVSTCLPLVIYVSCGHNDHYVERKCNWETGLIFRQVGSDFSDAVGGKSVYTREERGMVSKS